MIDLTPDGLLLVGDAGFVGGLAGVDGGDHPGTTSLIGGN
jgi:hypothetical protein